MPLSLPEFLCQMAASPALTLTVLLTLAVLLVNGWTDAPNAIAAAVVTGALPFRPAVGLSAKTILASGFLLLGGALLLVVSSLDYSDFYSLFGLLFTLAGAVPLLIHLGSRYLTWYHKSPPSSTNEDNKEDPHENS